MTYGLIRMANNPQYWERLEFTRRYLALKRGGKNITEIARILEKDPGTIHRILRSAAFRWCCEHLEKEEKLKAEGHPKINLPAPQREKRSVEELVSEARVEFASFIPDTLDFYRDCFRRNPPEEQELLGVWKDVERAEWAATQVSKGLGLTEPEHAMRPTITIHLGAIGHVLSQVMSEDIHAIDITPTNESARE